MTTTEIVLFATAHVDRGRQVLCHYDGYDPEGDVHVVCISSYMRELDIHLRLNTAFPDRDTALHFFTSYRTDELVRRKVFDALAGAAESARGELR